MTAVMMADEVRRSVRFAERMHLRKPDEQKAEDEERDDLAKERGRRRALSQPEPQLEDEEVEEPRDDERGGDADDEGAVVLSRRSGQRDAEPREEEDEAGREEQDDERRDETARRVEEARRPLAHRAEILASAALGSAASWKSRIAAMPAIRSRYGSSRSRAASSIPPIA